MKKMVLNKSVLSVFIICLFLSNIVLLNISQIVHLQKNDLSVIEQFYTTTNLPTKILFGIMFSKDNTNKNTNKQNKSKNTNRNYNNDMLYSPTNLNIFCATNRLVSFFTNNMLFNCLYEHKIVEYPLKIPFCCMYIFMLLLLKLLFNVLPRSISINYNKINIERACIV